MNAHDMHCFHYNCNNSRDNTAEIPLLPLQLPGKKISGYRDTNKVD